MTVPYISKTLLFLELSAYLLFLIEEDMEDFLEAEPGLLQPVYCSSMPPYNAVSYQPFSLFISFN